MIGDGFYINEELQKLTLTIPLEFYGKGEVVGFTQYTYGLVKEMFQDYYELEVKIKSNEKMESVIYRDAGEKEPTVHILTSKSGKKESLFHINMWKRTSIRKTFLISGKSASIQGGYCYFHPSTFPI